MPISEKDIFASLMKDPNHAYNPIEKVWAEAQQRARQFRNNEKALSLAFDDSPALEKLLEFMQKADDDYDNPEEFRGRVKNSWLTNRTALRKLRDTMNKYGESYGGDFGWEENRRASVQPLEEVTYQATADADTTTDDIYSIGAEYARNGPILDHLLTLGRDGLDEGIEDILQRFFTPNGQIKPELIAQARAMSEHEHLNENLYPYTLEQRQAATDDQTAFEEGSGAARGEGPSDEERDALFGGGPIASTEDEGDDPIEDDPDVEPSTDAPLESLIEGDDQGTTEEETPSEEEEPTPEVRTSDNHLLLKYELQIIPLTLTN